MQAVGNGSYCFKSTLLTMLPAHSNHFASCKKSYNNTDTKAKCTYDKVPLQAARKPEILFCLSSRHSVKIYQS